MNDQSWEQMLLMPLNLPKLIELLKMDGQGPTAVDSHYIVYTVRKPSHEWSELDLNQSRTGSLDFWSSIEI